MTIVKWGIIGPGAIAHNYADGLLGAESGELVAIGSKNPERRAAFGDAYSIDPRHRHSDYTSLVNDTVVDAVYVSTPHVSHAELAIMAMRAGKHVLCEKPAGMTASQVVAMIEVAKQQDVFFMEAFMYRCHPQIDRLLGIIKSGEIGEVQHVHASMGYCATPDPASRAFNPELGGGGILDVGCYPVSLARLIAGVAIGQNFDDPATVTGAGLLGATGVDEVAIALLVFDSGVTAECSTAITHDLENSATITGSLGAVRLPNPWTPGRNKGPSNATITVTVEDGHRVERIQRPEQLFVFEAEYASRAILDRLKEPSTPCLSHADSIGNAEVLDKWRHAINYQVSEESPVTNREIPCVMPTGHPQIPKQQIKGITIPVSSLILGCDNKNTIADGAIVWDAWLEAGGNAFDTAFVYGSGLHEEVLGGWIRNRGVADEVVVTVKGAHTPCCTPDAIESQLEQSLQRLQSDKAEVYIMHRDNLDVPVDEFVDVLNRLVQAGRIGVFGGSNWSVERFQAASAYAEKNQLLNFSILNNNLSLAVMEKPVWKGCVTSNTPETLAFLRDNNVIHFSWSSQARGYFLPSELRHRLPKSTAPETCFASTFNEERRRRAQQLADEHGVSMHNIATAWVLNQSFPSFALTGPRSAGEIVSTLPALTLSLSVEELAWLNLESELL